MPILNEFSYEFGQQPCDNFTPDERAEWFGRVSYECPIARGQREFCLNCHRDHHMGGWGTCTQEARQREEARRADQA